MDWPRLIASGAGIGSLPYAPGSFGALLGLLLAALLLYFGHGPLVLGTLLVSAAGVWAVQRVGGGNDPSWIVVDEIAGQMLAALALPYDSVAGLGLAFVLFRLFDITKLGPIGRLDQRHDAWGVMADDWLAGAFAGVAVFVILFLFPS